MQVETRIDPDRNIPSYAAGYGEWVDPGPWAPYYSEELVRWREGEGSWNDWYNLPRPQALPAPGGISVEPTANFVHADKALCTRIQCGFVGQAEAGNEVLAACADAGYVGERAGCQDPICRAYAAGECADVEIAAESVAQYIPPEGPAPLPFPVPDAPAIPIHKPMPSITGGSGLPLMAGDVLPAGNGCGFAGWVDAHKLLAGALVVGGFLLLRK